MFVTERVIGTSRNAQYRVETIDVAPSPAE